MDKKSQRKSVLVSVRREKDAMYVCNDRGLEWQFPERMSKRVAIASLVYGSMIGQVEELDSYCDYYRVTIEVERLDEKQ